MHWIVSFAVELAAFPCEAPCEAPYELFGFDQREQNLLMELKTDWKQMLMEPKTDWKSWTLSEEWDLSSLKKIEFLWLFVGLLYLPVLPSDHLRQRHPCQWYQERDCQRKSLGC